MSKQRPNPDKITNELAGASAFFKPQSTPAPQPSPESSPVKESVTPVQQRPPVRPVLPIRRQMIRHPFELYMDQLDRLRNAAQTERRQGGAGSMSKMVRDAIDHYLDHLPPTAD